jgi:hypothetical protein
MKKNFWLLMAAAMTSAVSAVETTEDMAKKTKIENEEQEGEIGVQSQDKLPTSNADEEAINNLTQKITAILPEIKPEIRRMKTGKDFLKGVDDNNAAKELAVWIKNWDLSGYHYTGELSFLDYLDIMETYFSHSHFPLNWGRLDIVTALNAIYKKYNKNHDMDFSKVLFEEPN